MKQRMSTETLMDILLTRIKSNGNNPTSGSFLYDLLIALGDLEQYEGGKKNNHIEIAKSADKNEEKNEIYKK